MNAANLLVFKGDHMVIPLRHPCQILELRMFLHLHTLVKILPIILQSKERRFEKVLHCNLHLLHIKSITFRFCE